MSTLGRFVVPLDPRDIGRCETPRLRNAPLTALRMRDGSVETIQETIERELYCPDDDKVGAFVDHICG